MIFGHPKISGGKGPNNLLLHTLDAISLEKGRIAIIQPNHQGLRMGLLNFLTGLY
jgi:hypothetical protein